MREAVWALLAAGIMVGALAPQASAGHSQDEDCTTVHYAITQDLAGAVSACPSDNQLPAGPPLPDQPDIDNPATEESEHQCPEYGFIMPFRDGEIWLCVEVNTKSPSLPGLDLPSPGTPHVGTAQCPDYTEGGVILELGEGRFGACVVVIYEQPENLWDGPIVTSFQECDIPEGGVDPAIRIRDGGIAFCIVPIIEPGPIVDPDPPGVGEPPAGVDTEPCSSRATDPTVFILDGYVQVCIDAGAGSY